MSMEPPLTQQTNRRLNERKFNQMGVARGKRKEVDIFSLI